MGRKWTEEQEDIIRTFAHFGPEAIAEEIRQQTGVARSASATQRQASRMGVSLRRYKRCPRCGRARKRLNRWTGLCATCNQDELIARQDARRRRLEEIMREEEEDERGTQEYRRKERELNRKMRSNERLAEQLNVGSRNAGWGWEDDYGDSAKLSKSLSNPRSGAEKNSRP